MSGSGHRSCGPGGPKPQVKLAAELCSMRGCPIRCWFEGRKGSWRDVRLSIVCQRQSPCREASGEGEASVAAETTGLKGPWREAEAQCGVSVCEHGWRYPSWPERSIWIPLEAELQAAVSPPAGCWEWNSGPFQSSACSLWLNHLSSYSSVQCTEVLFPSS